MSETISTSAPTAGASGSGGAQTSSPAPTSQGTAGAQAFGQNQAAPEGKTQETNSIGVPKTSEAPQTPAQGPRKLAGADMDALVEVKIGGKVQEMPLKEVIRLQQLETASRQKMTEAQRERQQAMQERELAKKDPERYMRDVLGLDPDSWSEERLAKKYEIQQMSPEARRAMELEQELGTVKAREAKSREPLISEIQKYVSPEEFEQVQRDAPNASLEQIQTYLQNKRMAFQQGVDQTSNELLEAWQKTGLPRQKDFGAWMAQVMVEHQKKAIEHKKRTGEDLPPLQAEEAAAKVKTRFLNSTKSLFAQMDAQAIQEFLGEEIVQKLRAHDVARVSKPQTPPWASSEPQTPTQQSDTKNYMNESEYRHWNKTGEYPARFKNKPA